VDGKRCCTSMVLFQSHQPRFHPLALSLLPAMLSPLGKVDIGPMEDLGVELYGCLSPRVGVILSSLSALPSMLSTIEGETITDVVAPVL
jgi:hypothetical protein